MILLTSKVTEDQIKSAQSDLGGTYFKFVVDLKSEKIIIGGERHFQAEQMLLDSGSSQVDLWGGGIEWNTREVDYESMINIRPRDNNMGREVKSNSIKVLINDILRKYFDGLNYNE